MGFSAKELDSNGSVFIETDDVVVEVRKSPNIKVELSDDLKKEVEADPWLFLIRGENCLSMKGMLLGKATYRIRKNNHT